MYAPDFSKYSLEELYDSLNHIDKNLYPDRVKIIQDLITQKENNPSLFSEEQSSPRPQPKEIAQNKIAKKPKFVEVVTKEGETIKQKLARREQRLGAAFLDAIFMGIPIGLIVFLFFNPQENTDLYSLSIQKQLLLLALGQILFLSFNGYFLWKNGQTIGKKILGIRIVNLNGITPFFLDLYARRYLTITIISYLPVVGMALSLINILFIFRKDLRCIHDHLAGTRVIMA